MEEKGTARTKIDESLKRFVSSARSFYLATAASDGQPYIQHRGGPPGFLQVLDDTTLAFADFAGNRQYISTGNLDANPKAMIFIMDYRTRHRVKIWGTARVIEDDDDLVGRLMPESYHARPEAAIVFTVTSWDTNCQQHIPRMIFAEDATTLAEHVRALQAENTRLREALGVRPKTDREAQ